MTQPIGIVGSLEKASDWWVVSSLPHVLPTHTFWDPILEVFDCLSLRSDVEAPNPLIFSTVDTGLASALSAARRLRDAAVAPEGCRQS